MQYILTSPRRQGSPEHVVFILDVVLVEETVEFSNLSIVIEVQLIPDELV